MVYNPMAQTAWEEFWASQLLRERPWMHKRWDLKQHQRFTFMLKYPFQFHLKESSPSSCWGLLSLLSAKTSISKCGLMASVVSCDSCVSLTINRRLKESRTSRQKRKWYSKSELNSNPSRGGHWAKNEALLCCFTHYLESKQKISPCQKLSSLSFYQTICFLCHFVSLKIGPPRWDLRGARVLNFF